MIMDAIGKSDFFSIFSTGCLMFYIATRLMRMQWESKDAELFRRILGYTFFGFGLILLVVALTRIPGREVQRNQPGIEQQPIQQGGIKPMEQGQAPGNKK